MPISALGSDVTKPLIKRHLDAIRCGFTLFELLIVVSIIALGSAGVVLAMRDAGQSALEREATRLAALLDAARAQSRATGVPIVWRAQSDQGDQSQMQWQGDTTAKTPKSRPNALPTQWLSDGVSVTPNRVVLGPDPVITPVRLTLQLGTNRLTIATDGVDPFKIEPEKPSP